jgi:two-component system, response regulator
MTTPERAPARARILLVEDDANDAELALRALGKGLAGQVHHARDGAEALSYLFDAVSVEPHGPAGLRLVLLDLKLPKVDGLEVLARIRATPGTRSLPVVILTSSMLPRDVAACYEAGANSYVVKRVEFEQQALALRSIAEYWLHLNVAAGS